MANNTPFDKAILERICDVLGDTSMGLTGSEIGSILSQHSVHDVSPTSSKRVRIFEALCARQKQDKSGNHVIGFIHASMNPVLVCDSGKMVN